MRWPGARSDGRRICPCTPRRVFDSSFPRRPATGTISLSARRGRRRAGAPPGRYVSPRCALRASGTTGPARSVATVTMYEHVRSDDHDVARWTIEVDELAGYAKHATKARDALAEIGLSRLDGDTLTVAAAAAGVHLAGAVRTSRRSARSHDARDRRLPRRARRACRHHRGELAGHHRTTRSRVPPRPARGGATHAHGARRGQEGAPAGDRRARRGALRLARHTDGPGTRPRRPPHQLDDRHRPSRRPMSWPRSSRCMSCSNGAASLRTRRWRASSNRPRPPS